ncbi:MAG: hypothetical protein M3O41_03785 [Pseudomonadota bacterium]|nr:hypothetical protein [Pseudomonadota bacterium]
MNTLTDMAGNASGPHARIVYTFSIDWLGHRRMIPRSEHALLPGYLAGDALHRLQNRQAALLLDDCTEACRFSKQLGAALITLFEDTRVPLSSVFVVSQNRAFLRDLASWLAATGRPNISSWYYSYYLASIAARSRNHFSRAGVWRDHVSMAWHRIVGETSGERKFICMNNMPKPHRLGVLVNLITEGFIQDGFVSFAGNEVIKEPYHDVEDLVLAVSQVLDVGGARRQQILETLRTIHGGPGLSIDRVVPGVMRCGDIVNDLNSEFFGKSLFTIHCETEFTAGKCCRITEKTFKPLINFHPFVLFGDPGALALIRDLGFKTFSPFIDERYDEELDPHRRFELAWREVARLARMSKRELRHRVRQLWPVLQYNAEYALDGLRDHLLFKCGFPVLEGICRFQ